MYAIVQVGGRQYRAAPGERLVVDRLDVEPGSRVHLSDVRMLIAEEGDQGETQIGRPRLDGVAVAARAVSHFRGPKILVFKYKPKKRYRRHRGFRAELTELRVEEVRLGAYHDAPAESAKKQATRVGAKERDGGETTPEATAKATKARAPSRGGPRTAAKSEVVTAAAEVKAAPEAKPKAARATRKPATPAPAPMEKKKPGSPAKTRGKSENTDGS
ncbi:MAG: 50S ribosomal protein L21 [Candidatus Dormiibacterota bacterium]|jgi:large subunit ribosomal protein L21